MLILNSGGTDKNISHRIENTEIMYMNSSKLDIDGNIKLSGFISNDGICRIENCFIGKLGKTSASYACFGHYEYISDSGSAYAILQTDGGNTLLIWFTYFL